MNLFIRVLAFCLLAACSQTARSAEPPKEIADLFPPGTLAYAELHNPAELAPQLAAVFKGTVLEDSIPFIHSRKDSAKTLFELSNKRYAALIGLLASPEMLAEFKRIRVAGGITGFTPQGDAEAALVVLTHDSPAAGVAARAFLTMSPQLRKVGEVSKIPVFQYRTPNINYDPNGNPLIQNDKGFTDGPSEMTFAYTPGLFVVGTSKTAIGHAVKRFLGEEKSGGLGGVATFKEAATEHRHAGLFFYIDYPEFAAKFGTAMRVNGLPRGEGMQLRTILTGGDTELFDWFNLTVNPKAVKFVAGSVRFRDGGISATLAAKLDPAHKSPLLDFLSGPGAKMELLHHALHPAQFAFGVTLPEKDRANAVVGFLDSTAKANGEIGRLPRDIVKELSAKYKLSVSDELIGKVRAVTVAMPAKQDLPKGGRPGPMIVLHADDAAAAGAWEDFFPKLLAELAGAAAVPQPSSESINGVKVFTITGTGLRWNAPVHYARNGTAVALGLDRRLVAAAVKAEAPGSVVGGNKVVSPPSGESVALFGVISLGQVIPQLLEKPRPNGPVVPIDEPPVFRNGQPIPESVMEELKKARKELAAALDVVPPAIVSARRLGNELRFELFQPNVQKGGLKPAIDAAANWIDRKTSIMGDGRDWDGREERGRW